MKLITSNSIALRAIENWSYSYNPSFTCYGPPSPKQLDITEKLQSLNKSTVNHLDVIDIIGNDTWTRVPYCDECGAQTLPMIKLEDSLKRRDPSRIISLAHLCPNCLSKALELSVISK